jgi:fumarylacetoacetase
VAGADDMTVLPWGAVRPHGAQRALPAVRCGDDALVLSTLAEDGLLGGDQALAAALQQQKLNALIELGPAAWRELRERLAELVAGGAVPEAARVALDACDTPLPIAVTDMVDFYASLEHATNFGRIFRPGAPAVRENWRHMPVGYHARASAVLVSGTPVRRPHGQVVLGELIPTRELDLECELGYVCGPTVAGPLAIDDAERHIFGVVLVNDWSARDVQRLEYEPLGPFLGKSFATSMSAWITPLDALAHARVTPPAQDPQPASYLQAQDPWTLEVALEIELDGEVISRPQARGLYWTPSQMLAHLTVNGATLTAGDLVASGTISGAAPASEGSLAEVWRGERWLQDGAEIVLRGRAGSVELGEVRGRILPAADVS